MVLQVSERVSTGLETILQLFIQSVKILEFVTVSIPYVCRCRCRVLDMRKHIHTGMSDVEQNVMLI